MVSLEYSNLSRDLTKKISPTDKKNNGIYFTPPSTIDKNMKFLAPYMSSVKDVLEPSCGSCEYIYGLFRHYSDIHVVGIEKNKTIFDSIEKFQGERLKLFNVDFLTHKFNKKFDLIIGNPPYFVIKKSDVDSAYDKYYDGRPNIFIMFMIRSLSLLNPDGIVSLILPKNFINCLYYDKTRKFIYENFTILNIEECKDHYLETKQDTISLTIQNKSDSSDNNKKYCIQISKYSIFGEPFIIDRLNYLYSDSTTLSQLGYNVKVGSIVWNQCKSILSSDTSKTMLIYSSDISNNKLVLQSYSNQDKKNYIDKHGDTTPVLVVNRGYGVGEYKFNYCLINQEKEYLIENHLICVRDLSPTTREESIGKYGKIMKSFGNEKTTEFIKLYFGNNAINTNELCNILPIYEI